MKHVFFRAFGATIFVVPFFTLIFAGNENELAPVPSTAVEENSVVAVPQDPDFSFDEERAVAKKVQPDEESVVASAAEQEGDPASKGDSAEVVAEDNSLEPEAEELNPNEVVEPVAIREEGSDEPLQDLQEPDMSAKEVSEAVVQEGAEVESERDDFATVILQEEPSVLSQEEGLTDGPVEGASWIDDQEEAPKEVAPILSHHQLDSVEDGPGNWFFKAQIMKRARVEINEIRKIMERVQALREPNQKLANALDGRFDAFYNECGFQKGEIVVSLKYIEEQLAGLKSENAPALGVQQAPGMAESLKDLEIKRDLLKQMQQDFDEIVENDKVSRELFTLFGNELGRVNQYLDVALEKYEAIENTLNDEAAEFDLHAIEASKANIENIERYLVGDFSGFYSKLSGRVDELMAHVRADLQKLREMGVELNRKIREERARQEAERLEAEKRRKQEELQRIEDAKLWNRVKHWGQSAWHWVLDAVNAVGKMFVSDTKNKPEAAS